MGIKFIGIARKNAQRQKSNDLFPKSVEKMLQQTLEEISTARDPQADGTVGSLILSTLDPETLTPIKDEQKTDYKVVKSKQMFISDY